MDPKTALRIALALERIAARLELLTVDTSQEPEEVTCSHPETERLNLGAGETTGWMCQMCGHQSLS